jgi:replicative DNA helicase
VGGRQNVGKTIWILQAARNVALAGTAAVVVEYEHDEVHMLHRLLCMESYLSSGGASPVTLAEIRDAVVGAVGRGEQQGLHAILQRLPGARRAWETVGRYLDLLLLARADPIKTTLDVINEYACWVRARHGHGIIFVDYLQKVVPALDLRDLPGEQQITLAVQGLKNIALTTGIPIVAVSGLDIEGLKRDEARVDDLQGGPATKYEPDAALMLLPGREDRDLIRFRVEKNRAGPADVEMAYRRIGQHFTFNPEEEE